MAIARLWETIYSNVNYPFQKDAPKVTSEPPAEYYSYGHRNPTGSYVTTFEVTLDMKDKCLYLHFEGVKSAMYVWVNGERVGYSQNSMSPAEFDITEFVKNGTNRLAVEVYRWSDGSYLEDQDMWRLSGILRPVELWVRPRTNIRDYRFSSDLSDDMRSATFGTEIWIRNQTDRKVKDLTVEINLVGKDNRGNKLDKKMVAPVGTIQAFSETSVTLSEMLREPQLWSAEKPHLYDIHIKLRRKNELLESFEYHWGIRKIEIAGDVFKVNGKAVKLKGVNRHDFHPRMGFFVDSRTMERDIRLIKQANINMIRTSHYHICHCCTSYVTSMDLRNGRSEPRKSCLRLGEQSIRGQPAMDTGPCGQSSGRGGKGQEPSVHPVLVIGQRGRKRCQFASHGRHSPRLRFHQADIRRYRPHRIRRL